MPRKFKTYQTSQGFFDLAIAVPSTKAALEGFDDQSVAKASRKRASRQLRHKLAALRGRGARLASPSANRNIRHRSGVPSF
jgi:hypothetical protein